jgi:PAS domain S-box-containing protein
MTIAKRGHDDDEALRGEQRFRALIENLADVVTILEADGSVRYVNPSVQRVLGYRPDDRDGANVFRLIHPADVDQARAAFARVVSRTGFQGPIEVRARHADGSWLVLEVSATNLLTDPSVRGIVGIARDITERKRVEDVWRFLAEASAVLAGPLDIERALVEVANLAMRGYADWCLVDLVEHDGAVRRLAASHVTPAGPLTVSAVRRCFPFGPMSATGRHT